jgi:hypothetical protein
MNKFETRKKYLQDRLIIKLSQFGIALQSDYFICNRMDGNYPHSADFQQYYLVLLDDAKHIYINTQIPNIFEFLNILRDVCISGSKKFFFYLAGEPCIPQKIIDILRPHAYKIFAQNNTHDLLDVHNMPIGIRDGEEVFPSHKYFTGKTLLEVMNSDKVKDILVYLCFSDTHFERRRCENELGGKDFVWNANIREFKPQKSLHCGKVPVDINYELTHKSHYTLCPSGVGEATHRFFEAIALDSVPIVKRTHGPFDKLYNIFPCLIVDDWNTVTQDLLINNLNLHKQKISTFKSRYPNFLTDINYIRDIMILM